jgi:putative phosphoribosyl transferase
MIASEKASGVDQVRVSSLGLPGLLRRPSTAASGIVVFAHGSGSSRLSPRNNFVASALAESGLATLLFDLLTDEEAADRRNVFDIGLLAGRLVLAADWVKRHEAVAGLPLGYFGASTGAAAALVAAARDPAACKAVVSRGGRPDLAGEALPLVEAPTLLIVGGEDPDVLELNRQAARRLRCEHRLAVVPDATHLFEEPGTLEAVVDLARHWFLDHLAGSARQGRGAD